MPPKKHVIARFDPARPRPIREFRDVTQKLVESLFVRGLTFTEMAEQTGIPRHELQKRYSQVVNQFMTAAEQMTDEWAKVETLRILRQCRDRMAEIREHADYVVAEAEKKGEKFLPIDHYKALREENKLAYRIVADSVKSLTRPNGSSGHPKNPERANPDFSEASMEAEKARKQFREIIINRQGYHDDSVLTDEVLQNLKDATADTSLFGED